MDTVVYLSNQQIQVVSGISGNKKVDVKRCYVTEAPEGSIINGMIMDPESFVNHMKEFWKNNKLPDKNVTLVINSTKIMGKTIDLPQKISGKKALEFIEREFNDVRRDDSTVYSYIPIGSEGSVKKVYAEAITQDFIKDYLDIFKEIGVKLSKIYSGEGSLINLVALTYGKIYKTFIMQIADKTMLTTLLFVNGSFYYFNSVRSFHDKDTFEYTMDVGRSVSQIMQFMQAHQIEYPLESVVLAGIDYNNLSMYQSAIMQQGINCKIETFGSMSISARGFDIQTCLHGASGLVVVGKSQNLLSNYSASKKSKDENSGLSFAKNFIGVGVVLLVMVTALIVVTVIRNGRQKELDKILAINEDPMVLMDVAVYDVVVERNAFLSAQMRSIVTIEENLVTYPTGNRDVKSEILESAGEYAEVHFDAFNADEGRLDMTAYAKDVDDINLFIKELKKLDVFTSISYSGYTFSETSGKWIINVTCTLSEAAGK